jgi:TolB-like protein/DNA-directed RNA polymerase specialized sigma24 family protein
LRSIAAALTGALAMMIPVPPPGTSADDDTAGSEQPTSEERDSPPTATVSAFDYAEFAAAVKDALRDIHSPDLLARNPLLLHGVCNLGRSAGPQELRALLSETVNTLFANPRDEKLRQVLKLTYCQPGLKQEVVADRLSLSFGTYRRHLASSRERLARWLWESWQVAPIQSELPSAATPADKPGGDPAPPPEAGELAPPRLSLVVLPFLNIGGNAQDDPFVDGVTETLTTDLARSPGVFVISRTTAFAYKHKPVDTRQIGRELGVRYVLEGSVQNVGERMRFNAQLVDADSGAHLWAERFDKQRTDLLDMQDEVTTRLARTIHIELVAAESRRSGREHPDRLDSVDHALHGWAAWNQHLSLETARQARHFFEAALRLDERNVGALIGFVNAHMWEVNMSYASDDRAGQIRAAEAAATKALKLAPDSADAHVAHGTVLYAMRLPERALREFEFAVSLDGNLATAHAYLGLIKFSLGRARDTRAHVAEAMRLSPRDPLLFHWHFFVGVADVYLGRVVHGLVSLRKSVEINPNWGFSHFILAGALGLAGLLAEAAELRAVVQRLAPNFTIAKFRAEAMSDNPVYLAQRERFYQGLRLAGVPEG